jgi:hypothetical protein
MEAKDLTAAVRSKIFENTESMSFNFKVRFA